MKKFILILLIFNFLFFISCSVSEVTEKPQISLLEDKVKSQEPTSGPEIDEIDIGVIEIITPRSKYSVPSEDFILDWEEYIADKYDIQLNLLFVADHLTSQVIRNDEEKAGIDIEELEDKAENGGLVYVNSPLDLGDLVKSGLIIPVNQYIPMVQAIAVLDDSILSQFSDGEGNIWGFPLIQKNESIVRVYNGDWLEQLGQDIPKSLDEFLVYAEYVKNSDPDGNGKNDSYIQTYQEELFLLEFMDIFKAFGCYSGIASPIGYNPQLGKYENLIFNDGFIEAMIFIRGLQEDGYIKRTMASGQDRKNQDFYVASSFMYQYMELKKCSMMIPGYYLLGPNEIQLIKSTAPAGCFAILQGTDKAAEKVEAIINILQNNTDAYMDFNFGIKGRTYQDNGDSYVFKFYNDDGTVVPSIRIDTDIELLNSEKKPYRYEAIRDEMNIIISIDEAKVWDEFVTGAKKYNGTDLAYSISHIESCNAIDVLNARIRDVSKELYISILEENVAITDAILNYHTKLDNMGILDELEEINFSLGY